MMQNLQYSNISLYKQKKNPTLEHVKKNCIHLSAVCLTALPSADTRLPSEIPNKIRASKLCHFCESTTCYMDFEYFFNTI